MKLRIEGNTLMECVLEKGEITVEIPCNITIIADRAFFGCAGLISIKFRGALTQIGEYAFYNCIRLTSIQLADSLTQIGRCAFSGCSALNSIKLQGRSTQIGVAEIPSKITVIAYRMFSGCFCLTSFIFPPGLTEIEAYAFFQCGITSALLPDGLNKLGEYAFSDCFGLKSIYLPDKITTINNATFCCCRSLAKIRLPSNITRVGKFAFFHCFGLRSIELSVNLKYIDDSAFFGCSSLASIRFPDKMLKIGKYAFCGCLSLFLMELPVSLTSIGINAFENVCNYMLVIAGMAVVDKYRANFPRAIAISNHSHSELDQLLSVKLQLDSETICQVKSIPLQDKMLLYLSFVVVGGHMTAGDCISNKCSLVSSIFKKKIFTSIDKGKDIYYRNRCSLIISTFISPRDFLRFNKAQKEPGLLFQRSLGI